MARARRTTKNGQGLRVGKTGARPPQLSRANADRLELYILSVQSPEHEIDFVTAQFRAIRKRPLRRLREDFAGTGISACEFVKRHAENSAVALDLHKPTLAWGMRRHVKAMTPEQQGRIKLLARNVLEPGAEGRGVDAVLAMNFSYWIFMTREALRTYFVGVRASLVKDGVFFCDVHGGYEATKEMEERRKVYAGKGRWFKYVWEQHAFDPLSNRCDCRIHFEFEKGPAMRNAFSYSWRVWSVPELRELLLEAGFANVRIYLEGDNGKGGGDGVFRARTKGDPDASFIGYIAAWG